MAFAVFASLLVGLCLTTADARAETRTLKLYNTHTHERVSITFKKNGRYIQSGLRDLNRFLRDWRRNESTKMDPELFDLVWEVYQKVGASQPIHVVSGYRSPATNNMLRSRSKGVAKNSQHTRGKAMDFFIPGVNLSTLRKTGLRKEVGGVGFYPTSGSPFVHMDTGSVRHWPRMTRSQLAAVFPDGVTLHVPTDGKPMPGYQTALARHKSGRAGTVTVASNNTPSTTGQVLRSASDDGAIVRPGTGSGSGKGLLATFFDDDDEEDKASAAGEDNSGTPTRVASVNPGSLVPPASLPGVRAAEAGDKPAEPEKAPESAVGDLSQPPVPERKVEEKPAEEDRVVLAGIYPRIKPASPALLARAQANPNSLDAQAVRLREGKPAVAATQVAALSQPDEDRFRPTFAAAPRVKPEDVLAAAEFARASAVPRAAPPATGAAAIAAATGGLAKEQSPKATSLSEAVLAYGAPGAPIQTASAAAAIPAVSARSGPSATLAEALKRAPARAAAQPSISGTVPDRVIRDPLARFAALPDRSKVSEFMTGETSTRTAAFARLSHPNQRELKELFQTGDRVLPGNFKPALDAPRTDSFTGEAVVLLPMVSLR
ncbi:DUF882 domain-containing protein [Hongsoonwoonella zoysiae]|uniref:DUF882 domain-containing protein n=1 Tax=Hongsoonwoonella zoysiae TaxID=2821844 RepID=UPI003CCE0D78